MFYALLLYIGWMLMHNACFLNFVSNASDAMCIGLHCIVVDCISVLYILLYTGWIICMAYDLCNDSDMCTLCFWLVSTLFGAFVWWLTHSVSMVCDLFLTCDWIRLNTINTIHYNNIVYRYLEFWLDFFLFIAKLQKTRGTWVYFSLNDEQ
jgi:hypothetical protein